MVEIGSLTPATSMIVSSVMTAGRVIMVRVIAFMAYVDDTNQAKHSHCLPGGFGSMFNLQTGM